MKKEIKLPEISENAESAVVAEIMVSEGDHVDESQSLIAVESDKATVEVPAEFAGTIKDIKVKKDDEIKTGDVILVLEADGNGEDDKTIEKEEAKEKKPLPENKEEPKEQEDEEVEKEGVQQKNIKEPAKKQSFQEDVSSENNGSSADASMPAAPLARRLARELNIDLEEVKKADPEENRITSNDIMKYVKRLLEEKYHNGVKTAENNEQAEKLPDFSKWGNTEKETLSAVRKATAKTTSKSWRQIPHVTQFDEADITELENYRYQLKKDEEVRISLTAVLIKLLGEGLKKFPKFNASIDAANNEVIFKKYYNISIAVDTPKGLMMPVIRKVDKKSIKTIAEELKDLVTKAVDGKLDREDMEGGNIAISNLGTIGGTQFTPIIFPPQVAILGVGGLKTIPRYYEETKKFKPRKMVPLALSYDHRLIDGADAARFTNWLCKTLENPINVFLS